MRQMHNMDNARLLRIRGKLARYTFSMQWTPGKTNIIADAFCRAPIFDPEEEELTTSSTIQCLAASDEFKLLTTHKCEEYKLLWAYVQNSNHPIANDIQQSAAQGKRSTEETYITPQRTSQSTI